MTTSTRHLDIHQLRHELADHLRMFPVQDWPAEVLRAVVAVLDLHAPERAPAAVLELVRSTPPPEG